MFRAVLLLTCCFRHFRVTGQWILNKTTTQHNNYICIKDLIQCVFFHIFHFSLGVMNSRVAGVNIKVKSDVHIKSSQIQYWTHSSEPYHYRFQAYAFKNKNCRLKTKSVPCPFLSAFTSVWTPVELVSCAGSSYSPDSVLSTSCHFPIVHIKSRLAMMYVLHVCIL